MPGAIEAIRLPRWVCVAPKLRASNTVSTVHIGCEPNQERLATNYTSTTFNPNSFAAIKMRRTATGLFFRSGSAVVAGARGQLASSNACIEFVRQLQRMHPMPFEPTCKLQNIVVNARCFPIDLDLLAQRYSVHARYEITRFPGLVFRFGHGRAWVFIIFPSGNVIATGFSSWVEANLVFRWLFAHVLCEFKDSKAAARETAAEKKNRAFNNDAAFAVAMRAITRVGLKRSYDAMLRASARAAGIDTLDLAATWRAIAALPSSND